MLKTERGGGGKKTNACLGGRDEEEGGGKNVGHKIGKGEGKGPR